jgi:hypothetical protein
LVLCHFCFVIFGFLPSRLVSFVGVMA